jgi:hypothetical protein
MPSQENTMERLARLLPFRQFGRLRHLRGKTSCAPLHAPAESAGSPQLSMLPSALPAFARVSLHSTLHSATEQRGPVRVYHGPSRFIMVGTIDAVCRMIDRCIADEHAAPQRSA